MQRIAEARVIIFGVGGVGSWCAESLVRSGIRHLTIVDSDCVDASNCNRQLMATSKTIGQVKVFALRDRLFEINPDVEICALQMVYNASTAESFHLDTYNYIIDAIDSLTEKAQLILHATSLPSEIHFFSSMGAALRINPFMVRTSEFWKIKGDALARALRNKFKKQQTFPARKFFCVYSEETPLPNHALDLVPEPAESISVDSSGPNWNDRKAQINGSLSHITGTFGFALAGMVMQSLYDSFAKNG